MMLLPNHNNFELFSIRKTYRQYQANKVITRLYGIIEDEELKTNKLKMPKFYIKSSHTTVLVVSNKRNVDWNIFPV